MTVCTLSSCTNQEDKNTTSEKKSAHIQPQRYRKKLILKTTFDSFADSTFWVGEDSIYKGGISSGEYYFEQKNREPSYTFRETEFTDSSNFEYTASVCGSNSDSSTFYGIYMGDFEPDTSDLTFEVNNNGDYNIKLGWSIGQGNKDYLKNTAYKVLTISKINDKYTFYANGHKLLVYYPERLMNVKFGLSTSTTGIVWCDFARIYELLETNHLPPLP